MMYYEDTPTPPNFRDRLLKLTETLRHRYNYKYLILVIFLPSLFSLGLSLALDRSFHSVKLNSPLAANNEILGEASDSAKTAQLSGEASVSTPEAKPQTPTPPPAPKAAEPAATPVSNQAVSVTESQGRLNFANNKFGVYLNNVGGDLDLAGQLINSSGGDWGWVLAPLSIHDNGKDNWNGLFSKMAEKHLIPIIQLIEPDAQHQIPTEGEIDDMARFLGSLNWPTRLKVVSAFNEVNASEYWGGKIDPEGYARILNRLVDQLKQQSPDFFVLNGAFNASAQTGDPTNIHCIKTDLGVESCYLSEIGYLKRMNDAVPDIFKKLDGWASHAYPFPGYRGTPSDQRVGAESSFEAGRNTIHSYKFELRLLAQYGVKLPIFITETGWPHKEGQTQHPEWYDAATVANFYKQAFVNYFLPDPNVVAVTPFSLTNNFDNFAFVGGDGAKFPQWDAIVAIKKIAGNPPR
ncbi:MAG: hypothetical protein M1352_01645 [Patescibacteria group bacterium]|nr:hypothetical protein [Patescibacteria group bacterium]